ncbi:WXG100 family type VII secretion target [Nocardia sp. NBC_00565]|uniref:WXG100 family type VII secretion target n=1 Tax=Nocardia sp. NBC_00565 TaxID=2975993 RepID=UPI002E8227B5|nr:WXG100 family type VII secretion target [Nocardia sp. NBC_00565]WUC00655.1 WXG100 family type VII secretion target [Nocardia sp. NBC_00565]
MRKMPHTGEKTPIRYVDPDYTQTVEIFDNLSHKEIHDGVQLMNPVVLAAGQQAWQGSSTGLATAVEQAHNEIRTVLTDGWRGGAAESAADAVREFERHGQQLADVLAAVGQRLGQAGDAAEALRAAVVAPSNDAPDLSGALLDPTRATDNTATQKIADGTRQDVVQAMDSIYTNAFIPTGSGIPAFPDTVTGDVPQTADTTPAAAVPATTGIDTGTQTRTAPTVSTTAPATTAPHTTVEPAATAPTKPTTTQTTVTPASTADITPATAKPVVPTADSPATTTPAATTPTAAPDRAVRPGTTAPVVTAAAAPVVAPTVPGAGNSTADDERKRDERKRDVSSDAINGAGAGAVGGLMGGAMVAGDTPRSGMSTSAAAARSALARDEDDYDDDYHFFDDDLTFLEPADDGGELIGDMDPTTPPVVGEWTELE